MMKKIMKTFADGLQPVKNIVVVLTATTIFQCCSAEDPVTDASSPATWSSSAVKSTSGGSSSVSADNSALVALDVAIDRTSAEPAATVGEYFPEAEDDLAANTFDTEVHISFNGTTATADQVEGVSISTDGAHVTADHGSTKGVSYVVSGTTTAGSLTIVGDKKYEVVLSGADITNPDSTALNLLSKKRAYVVLADGTANRLADGTTTKADDHKAAFYCKGKLLMNGTGTLEVYGNYNNAIHSADYIVLRSGSNIYAKSTANHGVKANDGIIINGGILNVEVSAAGAKGINCEQDIIINGGRTTVVATGTGTYEDGEAKGAAAIKCDSTYTQNGGEVYLKATGSGGKALRADYEAYISGGTLCAVTTGGTYTYSRDTASPKAIKIGEKGVHGLLNISGGNVMVRSASSEGVESKGSITVSGGSLQVLSGDDAVNSSGDLYLLDGNVTAIGTGNDGIDANGNMYVEGGTIVAFGAGGAESGIDTGEQSRLYITGGSLFAIGGRIDATYTATADAQAYAQTTGSVAANATVTVASGANTLATFTMPPYNYSNGTIMVSAPGMTSGQSYTLNLGSASQTVTATTSSASGAMGGGMGGGMPGGRW